MKKADLTAFMEMDEYLELHVPKGREAGVVYVNVGVPFSAIPIMQKVRIYVEPTVDTPVTAAKKLRKQVADNIENHGWAAGTTFNPSELYYEIYPDEKSTVPFKCSANARYLKEHPEWKSS